MFGFYFFALHGHGSNGSEFSLYQPFRHLKVINAHPCTRRPNHFILFIGHVFQHLYHSCCSALGPLQFVNLFTTEQCWPTDRVLLLESPPGQVQRIIPSGALSKWCCIRSPWAPRTLFAAVSQCLSAEYSHCKICFCIWCSGFVTQFSAGTLQACIIGASALFHFESETVNKAGIWLRWSPASLCPQTGVCLSAGCLNLATPEVRRGSSA